MAFELKGLQPVGASARSGSPSLAGDGTTILPPGDNAKAVWSYGSGDLIATIATDGYFNEVRDLVNPFDAILLASANGQNLRWTSFLDVPKSPSTDDVTLSALNQDAA